MHSYNLECTVGNNVYELMTFTDEKQFITACSNCVADDNMLLCLRLSDACTKEMIYPNSFWVIKQVP